MQLAFKVDIMLNVLTVLLALLVAGWNSQLLRIRKQCQLIQANIVCSSRKVFFLHKIDRKYSPAVIHFVSSAYIVWCLAKGRDSGAGQWNQIRNFEAVKQKANPLDLSGH